MFTVSSVSSGDFCKVSIVISFHFQVEDFRFGVASFRDKEFVQQSLK
jgi:hypothetical protein